MASRDEHHLAAVHTDAALERTGATTWYQEAREPGLAIRWSLPSEQAEHLQDDDDHHDRADDVQDRVHRDLFPRPPQRPLGRLLWGAELVAHWCTTVGCREAAGTPPSGSDPSSPMDPPSVFHLATRLS